MERCVVLPIPAEPRLLPGGDLPTSHDDEEQQVRGVLFVLKCGVSLSFGFKQWGSWFFCKQGNSVQMLRVRNEGSEGRHVPRDEVEAVGYFLESEIRA